MADRATLLKILDLARWAPSGDNTQPWRFEIVSDGHIAVHGYDTRDWCVYDFNGHASHMAHGALLETLKIASTGYGFRAKWRWRPSPDTNPIYDFTLTADTDVTPDRLLPFVEQRMVQRRPMRMVALSAAQRSALVAASGSGYSVKMFETLGDRWAVARLLWQSARLRLTCPETYEVHRKIIEWGARYSEDRIPEAAVGVDPLTAKLMRRVMVSWARVDFFNRYLFGTYMPRVQLDLIPALACAGHLMIQPGAPLEGARDYVKLGAAMQRVWLTATLLGLHLQPEMTPVIFHWYARTKRAISKTHSINVGAAKLADEFERILGAEAQHGLGFFGRVGFSSVPKARSIRKPLDELLLRPDRR